MKSLTTLIFFAIAVCAFQGHLYAAQDAKKSIQWQTSFETAVAESKSTKKPILLLFTGGSWCPACVLLEKEVLSTQEFADATAKEFIFVKLIFPKSGANSDDPRTLAQNNQLADRFYVRGYPTIVVLDPEQKQIGSTGYRPGGPTPYITHLLKMVKEYTSYKQQMQNVGTQKFSGGQLKHLLDKARSLEFYGDINEIIRIGMESDQKAYFQIERYRLMAKEKALQEPEAIALKQELLQSDSPQLQQNAYQIALIDFEVLSNEAELEEISPEFAVAPLVSYLDKFAGQDKENTWRLQMLISQVFLDNNKLAQALRYAQSSYEAAPAKVQPEIATAIRNLSAELEE